jgi:hypothetical protein
MQSFALEGFEQFGKITRRDHSNKNKGRDGSERHISAFDKKTAVRKIRREKLNLRDIEASLASYD